MDSEQRWLDKFRCVFLIDDVKVKVEPGGAAASSMPPSSGGSVNVYGHNGRGVVHYR